MRVLTDMGPRTQVCSMNEDVARMISEKTEFDLTREDNGIAVPGIVILPDEGPYKTVEQLVVTRNRSINKEIQRIARKRQSSFQPLRLSKK